MTKPIIDTTEPLKGTRSFTLDKRSIDTDNRTVQLAFSSQEEVERWFGVEVLEHTPSAVDLGRLRDGGALLVNHNWDKQVGVVESADIGADRICRAVVRFGKSPEADQIFQDVIDGIRTKVSVGYIIDEYTQGEKDGVQYLTATRWTPYEISIVAVPADPTVGVGRSIDTNHESIKPKGKRTMSKEQIETPAAAPAATPASNAAEVRDAAANATKIVQERTVAILGLGDKFKEHGGAEVAAECIRNGKTVDQFNEIMLGRMSTHKPAATAEIGMSDKEVRQYSVVRALNALANPNNQEAQKAAAFERELSQAAAEKAGKQAQGLIIPVDVMRSPIGMDMNADQRTAFIDTAVRMGRRDLVKGTGGAGGYTVATILNSSMIELLRNQLVLEKAGATVMTGLQGDIAMPRQAGSATAYWVGEGVDATESQQTIDQVTLTPKTIAALTEYSRKLLIQSSIDVEAFVRADLTKIIALGVDLAGLYGTGSASQPTGLKNIVGLNTVDYAANTPTWAEIVQLETEVATDNADLGTMSYIMNAAGRGALKTTVKAANTAEFIWQNGEVNGYQAYASNQIAANDFWFGNWAELIIAMWSGIDLLADPYTKSANGGVRITAFQDVDIAARHAVSFCRGNNTL